MTLAVQGLTVRRGGMTVLSGIEVVVPPGQVVVVVGTNGAGKSTLLKAILGLVPSQGVVTWHGQPVPTDAAARARRLAYVPQRPALLAGLTVHTVVAQGRFPGLGSLARLGPADHAAVDAALRRVDALHLATRPFPQLSAGEQQRVMVARALATGAPVLLLDEPTASLDAAHARAFVRLMRGLADEGRTILMVAHDPAEIQALADQVVVLDGGRVVHRGGRDSLPAIPELPTPAVALPLPGPVPDPPAVRPVGVGQGVLLALAVVLAAVLPWLGWRAPPSPAPGTAAAATVADARGVAVACKPYRRIASLSLTSDAVLAAVADADRVVVACAYSRGLQARRWAGTPRLPALDDVEAVIAAHPDLVIAASTPADRLARLREAGIPVLIHGDMGGLADYARAARLIGQAIDAAVAGEQHAATLERRLARVAPALARRPRLLYVAAYGDLLTGGTVGTGFHDIITAAGGEDAAAAAWRGWPTFSIEQVVALAPDVVVYPASHAVSQRPGLRQWHVRWLPLPDDVLEDPTGEGLITAAEALAEHLAGPASAGQ